MEKIRTYKLGEICSIRSGKTPSTKKKEYWCLHKEKCDCIPWFTGTDVTRGTLETNKKITPLALSEQKLPLTTNNSLLFFHIECLVFFPAWPNVTSNQIISILEPDIKL